jgi:lipopolysaccharide export system permease protein
MNLIDRYIFRQLLGPTLLATVAFSTVMLLGQSLTFLDLIVNQGLSAAVFLKLTLLSLPALVSMILPITIFVASLVALNRLQTEQELVVCFAGGMSRWRVISPVVRLSVMAAIVSLVINLWVQPLCDRLMREEFFQLRNDLASSLVQPGQFTQPSKGLTVYAAQVQNHDTLKNLFVNEENDDGTTNTFSAREGQIAQRNGQPVLIMKHGSEQALSKTGVLNYAVFDEYTFELAPFVPKADVVHYKASDRYLHELFHPDLTQQWGAAKNNRLKLFAEGHARLAEPLYNIAMVVLALSAVLGGGFSRMGYGRRILVAIGVATVTRIMGFGMAAVADDNVWLNVLQYAVPLLAMIWGLHQVFRRRARPARTRARLGLAQAGAA